MGTVEAIQYQCSCGYTFQEQDIDFKTRTARCPYCGSASKISRRQLNGSPEVVENIEIAVSAFNDGDLERSKLAADHILKVSDDNAVALFINAYYGAFHGAKRSSDQLDLFFKTKLKELEIEEDEAEMLKNLILKVVLHLVPYEEDILEGFYNCQRPEDLEEFVECFSPLVMVKRNDIDWFTPKIIDLYCKISAQSNIVKTWFSLYKQIGANPESPEKNNDFFLVKKTQRFYETFVLGVEKVYNSIADETNKQKFIGALQQKKQIYAKYIK